VRNHRTATVFGRDIAAELDAGFNPGARVGFIVASAGLSARFLNDVRGYSGTSHDVVEHYCLDCTFRPWLDATDRLTATVTTLSGSKVVRTEKLQPDAKGEFTTGHDLKRGQTARITIADAWGNETAAPTSVTR